AQPLDANAELVQPGLVERLDAIDATDQLAMQAFQCRPREFPDRSVQRLTPSLTPPTALHPTLEGQKDFRILPAVERCRHCGICLLGRRADQRGEPAQRLLARHPRDQRIESTRHEDIELARTSALLRDPAHALAQAPTF